MLPSVQSYPQGGLEGARPALQALMERKIGAMTASRQPDPQAVAAQTQVRAEAQVHARVQAPASADAALETARAAQAALAAQQLHMANVQPKAVTWLLTANG